jgi:hypothetical protein
MPIRQWPISVDNGNDAAITVNDIDAIVQINVAVSPQGGLFDDDGLGYVIIFDIFGNDGPHRHVAIPFVGPIFLHFDIVLELDADLRRDDKIVGERHWRADAIRSEGRTRIGLSFQSLAFI